MSAMHLDGARLFNFVRIDCYSGQFRQRHREYLGVGVIFREPIDVMVEGVGCCRGEQATPSTSPRRSFMASE